MGCSSSTEAGSSPAPAANPGAKPGAAPSAGNNAAKPSIQTTIDPDLVSTEDVRSLFDFGAQLGKGNFGVVHWVTEKATGDKYACKTISKRKLVTAEDIEDVRREIQIMKHLGGHDNIVNLRGAYEDKHYIHLVLEVCAGGELFDSIAKAGHFSERKAAGVLRTIVSVVHHCHTMNVVHRDLKPENFLLTQDGVLKATDFGLSRFWKVGELMNEIVGSPFYVAPEVLKRSYGREADIWSCGVILYILLCGWPPFTGDSTQAIFKSILQSPLDLRSEPWPLITEHAKDLVKRMLTRDPARRLTAEQVLNHPWMKDQGVASEQPFIPEVLTRMRQFSQMNMLKREALKVIARNLPAIELEGMREMFKEMDEDGSGTITVSELKDGLRKKGAAVALTEVEAILVNIDLDGNMRLDYDEFIAATIHMRNLDRADVLLETFKHFDRDASGFITLDELKMALAQEKDDTVLQALMEQVDKNGDQKIDYDEFCDMMRADRYDKLAVASKVLRGKQASGGITADLADLEVAPDDLE